MLKKKKEEEIEQALQKAKEVEQHELLPTEQVVKIYKESLASLEKFKKMLTKDWFIKDVHKKKSLKKQKSRRKKR